MKSILGCLVVLAPAVAFAGNPRPGLEFGVTAGGDQAMQHEAVYVGGELALTPTWRLHAQLTRGEASSDAQMAPNVYDQLRGGLVARLCPTTGVCVLPGLDVAFMTESYKIGTVDTGVLGTWSEIEERGGFALVPRVALDVGSEHWHFRPGVEATLSTTINGGNAGNSDLIGVAGNAAVAYTW